MHIFDPKNGALLRHTPGPCVMQKFFDPCRARRRAEADIARRVQAAPHRNVVNIFSVSEDDAAGGCILQEVLTPLDDESAHELRGLGSDLRAALARDVRAALAHLHSLHVVYVDLHTGNVGWSQDDRCWKLFDFNMSGTVDPHDPLVWETEPSQGWRYRQVRRRSGSLFELDDAVLELFLLDDV